MASLQPDASPVAVTLADLLRAAAARIGDAGSDTARLDAELLTAHALDLTRVQLYTESMRPLEPAERGAVEALVARRVAREPVAYILGRAWFRDLRLHVDARVLIPRPETELLVEWALEAAAARDGPTRIADICTGSGAIAAAIAHEAPPGSVSVVATDMSGDALDVARTNVAEAGVEVELLQGDLLEPLAGRQLDIIVANPPYVLTSDAATLPPDVHDFEPHIALFVDDGDAMSIVRRLASAACDLLTPGGLLAIEIGVDQHDDVRREFESAGLRDVELRRDLQGIVRAVGARA